MTLHPIEILLYIWIIVILGIYLNQFREFIGPILSVLGLAG